MKYFINKIINKLKIYLIILKYFYMKLEKWKLDKKLNSNNCNLPNKNKFKLFLVSKKLFIVLFKKCKCH